ncbi:MAG: hypothetical protein H6733_02055 [Alphaproteobacteria bacterium]|nr:hypothetical protein [Alphaproteobacteria bacterium]
MHPGLEDLLLDELVALGVDARPSEGGIAFAATPEALAQVHAWSWIAGEVRVRLGRARASSLDELATGVRALPWSRYVHPHQPVEVEISSHGSRLRRGPAVERKVALAIGDALRGPRIAGGRAPREPVRVHVRVVDDRATLSIDASGDRLHRRGWRTDAARAPLRENLAAAVLVAAGWKPGERLVDPMCGSGTFPIEAARRAAGLPPRTGWTHAFERWPGHDPKPLKKALSRRPAAVPTPILGADRDARALTASTANARRAGVDKGMTLLQAALAELDPPASTGLLVANPPYGKRVAPAADIERTWSAYGRVIAERWLGWRVAVVAPDPRLLGRIHPEMRVVLRFVHGGIPVVVGRLDSR